MKRILGPLAILLVPGVLLAQGGTTTRPNVPVTTNGTMGTGRRTLEPPVLIKGDASPPTRADARATDDQSRAQAGTGTVTTHPGTVSTKTTTRKTTTNRKHRRVKRKTAR